MLTLEVELLHGVARLGSPENLATLGSRGDDGLMDPGEWPPSPARVFSALVAADGTRSRCRVTDGSELVALESASPPTILASPYGDVLRSGMCPRYVVIDETKKKTVQDYPARTAAVVQPGTRVSPRESVILYRWSDFTPTQEHLAALRARAARIGYLGCADTPVRVRVRSSDGGDHPGLRKWRPAADGEVSLPVPYAGLLDSLDAAYDALAAGKPGSRSWIPTERAFYTTHPSEFEQAPTVVWLRFDHPLPGRRIVSVTQALRDLVLRAFGDDNAPHVIHGHGEASEGYEQARFLALPEVGYPHARGRIRGAAAWLPPDTDAGIIQVVRAALRGQQDLYRGKVFRVRMEQFDGTVRPWSSTPPRWVGPARRWASAFPVVFERFAKGEPTRQDVLSMCRHALLPEPVSWRFSRVPLIAGGVDLAPHEVFRPGKARAQYQHLEVHFAEPVRGPLTIGRGRQLGLGLMAPLPAPRGDQHG